MTQRVRELLETGGAPAFYRTYMWQRAAAEARDLQHNECQRCKRREGNVDAAGQNDEKLAHGEQARHDHSRGDIDDVIRRIELA